MYVLRDVNGRIVGRFACPQTDPAVEWIDDNSPELAPTMEDRQKELEREVDAWLDQGAQARGYTSIVTACTYAASAHERFGPEGRAYLAWRDAVYAACYAILADVLGEVRPIPTKEELLAELPQLLLP